MKQRYLGFSFLAFSALLFMPENDFANAASPSKQVLPVVRVGIGMSVDDFRLRSTYAFPIQQRTKGDHDSGVFSISVPYTLQLIDGNKTLTLFDIGGEYFFTAIMTVGGKVHHISINPQSEKLTIEAAMTVAKKLHTWFQENGYVADDADTRIRITRVYGVEPSQPILTLSGVQAAMVDTSAKIEEVQLFSMTKGNTGLSLTLSNQRRMRARYNKKFDDESRVGSEEVYYLNLVVTDTR